MAADILSRLHDRLEAARTDAVDEAAEQLSLCLAELEALREQLESQSDLLARERERYTAFFEHAPFASVITTGSGSVREANRAACELLGVPGTYLKGKPLAIFFADADRANFRRELGEAAVDPKHGRRSWTGRVKLPEGREANVEVVASNLPFIKGAVTSLLLFLRRLD